MAKHTPGPWKLVQIRPDTLKIETEDGQRVAYMYADATVQDRSGRIFETFSEGQFANAKRIAAVPELLAACKSALEALQRPDVQALALDPLYRSELAHAIRKAEGK